MQRVIDGKLYDTKTAELLGEDSYGNSSDFTHWIEQLYRTKRGTYFLHGSGGPMSRWRKTIGQNQWSGGSGLRVLSIEEAKEWVEKHANKSYCAIFDPAPEA